MALNAEAIVKRHAVEQAMKAGVVGIGLLPHVPGVSALPIPFCSYPEIQLNFNMLHGKGDMVVDSFGLTETLSFNNKWIRVAIPWAAITFVSEEANRVERYRLNVEVEADARPAPRAPLTVIEGGGEVVSLDSEYRAAERRKRFRVVK